MCIAGSEQCGAPLDSGAEEVPVVQVLASTAAITEGALSSHQLGQEGLDWRTRCDVVTMAPMGTKEGIAGGIEMGMQGCCAVLLADTGVHRSEQVVLTEQVEQEVLEGANAHGGLIDFRHSDSSCQSNIR